ncbi:MAG: cytochrome P450 [Dehalococcoidia bacterium]|nr:cytochrome P450 [Dehalococcoidia bacterium]
MTALSQFNPLAPETVACPYPFYKAMREEAPVHQVPALGFFIVSRYEDAREVLGDAERFSSNSGPGVNGVLDPPDAELLAIQAEGWPAVNTLLTNDPPDHARYRGLVNKAFTPRRVAAMESSIRAIAAELLARFAGRGHAEIVSEFAVPLPLTVIADALGVSRGDLPTFKKWSDDSVAPLGGFLTRERQLACARSVVEFQKYFAARLDERRRHPQDDILTDLVNARLDGEKPLDTAEMLSILQQLLVAGNETTTNLIASGTMLLLQHPDQLSRVLADRSLIPGLVEEALRVESPVQGLFRMARIDTEVGGVRVPAGARLVVMYASANRDETVFPDAERFDVCREARGHLAFGYGTHFCLGSPLARMEAAVAFETLLDGTKNLRLAPGKNDLAHVPSFILRGLRQLHVEFDPV